MKCLDQEQLSAYAHRLLEGREEETATAHVDACPRCRAALEEYARLDAVLDEWKPSEPSPWFDTRLRQALAASGTRRPAGFLGLAWTRWVAVGALALLVGVGVWAWRRAHGPAVVPPVAQRVVPQKSPALQPATLAQAPTTASPSRIKQAPAKVAHAKARENASPEDDLRELEDYDLIANFEILSELPHGAKKIAK
jgi:hypothetical protein